MNYAHSELVARAPGPSLTTAGRPRHPAAGGGDGAAGGGAEAGDTRDLGLGLGCRSDKEQFCRAQRDNIGHFTDRV